MRIKSFSLAAICLSVFSSAHTTEDRVISLDNKRYNGTTQVEMKSQALGQADFFKLNPAPNASTFDSWYFDAMNPLTNETVIFNFEVQWPVDPDVNISEAFYRVTIFGSFLNGTSYRYEIYSQNVNITERADKSMRPRPVYKATIDAPELGIKGSIILQGNLAAPHYSCGTDAAGVDEQVIEGVGWANALPDANATAFLRIGDTAMSFKGYGYHDKTWVNRPFEKALQAAFWGHARLGPYAVVWWHSHGKMGGSSHLVALTAPTTRLGWGKGQIWPLVPGTPAPEGMIMRWDLGDAGVFVANITSTDIFVDIPFWQAGRGPVSGGFEGQESFTDETGLWSLNQLQPL
ncbi:hypothetical protein NM208_g3285 [Fusarium decemcellulare]|uniref:Uncharacterized protein n=1 Tax=Fusarium decemcellulare TaxID=57161 RepID=A0ACC1SPY8_9HYPO|nr:hypothetical protein NM208_g3285 [Fusarium decemcellulare]